MPVPMRAAARSPASWVVVALALSVALLLLRVTAELAHPRLPNVAPFAGAIFLEPRAANTTPFPFFRRAHSSPRGEARIAKWAEESFGPPPPPGHFPISDLGNGLLADLRTDRIFYVASADRFTDQWIAADGVSLQGLLSPMVTQYFYRSDSSRAAVAPITRAWPYFYHYKEFLTTAASDDVADRRVYRGVVDVDAEVFGALDGSVTHDAAVATTPREALVLIYNDWDDGAMESLAVLERFTTQHMGGRGADILVEVEWSALNSRIASVLNRSREGVVLLRPDAFYRMMQRAYPVDGGSAEPSEDAMGEESSRRAPSPSASHVLWMVRDKVGDAVMAAADRSAVRTGSAKESTRNGEDVDGDDADDTPHVAGALQLCGGLRLAAYPTEQPDQPSALFSAVPSPQFVLLGRNGLADSPRLTSPSLSLVTPWELQKFVLRHTVSSLFIRSYEQAAQLVRDYGRVAFLVLPEAYARAMRGGDGAEPRGGAAHQALLTAVAQAPTVTALRKLVPFFVLVPPSPSSSSSSSPSPSLHAPPAWWTGVPVTSTRVVDAQDVVTPLSSRDAAAAEVHRAIAASESLATLSVVETAIQRRGRGGATTSRPSAEAPWVRQNVVFPVISPRVAAPVLRAYEALVGSLVVDAVAALEAERRVWTVDGATFQDALAILRGDMYRLPPSSSQPQADVVIVLDEELPAGAESAHRPPSALSCGDTVRARELARRDVATAAGTNPKFMIVDANDHGFREELLRAAWPLPASGVNASGAVVCPSALVGGPLQGCSVLCVPGGGKDLYRLQPPLPETDAADAREGGRGRPLEHPTMAQLHRAAVRLAQAVESSGTGAAGTSRSMPALHTEWESTEVTGLAWRLYLPEGFSAPLVEFDLSSLGLPAEEAEVHVVLLTDGSCAQCANPAKAFRLLEHCAGTVEMRFHELDVAQFLSLPAAEQASLLYGDDTRHQMPLSLLGPHFLLGAGAASLIRPPRFLVQRGSRVLLTLNTLAYYDSAPWPRAVLDIAALAFHAEEKGGSLSQFPDVLQCIDSAMSAEVARKDRYRRGVRVSRESSQFLA